MNRFKLAIAQPRTGQYCKRKQQVQLLNVLDKCTQVLRDDRIWIRNKVKEGDPEIIQIFKKHAKKPQDISILQTHLRKHVMKIKDKCKKQQLQRFKENMNIGSLSNNSFERNGVHERSSKSIPYPKQMPSTMNYEQDDSEDERVYRDRNYSYSEEDDYREEPMLKRYNPIAKIKMTDPIVEEEELEQVVSHRSAHNRNKTVEKKSPERIQNERLSLPWHQISNNFMRKSEDNRKVVDLRDLDSDGQQEEQFVDPIPYQVNQSSQFYNNYTQYEHQAPFGKSKTQLEKRQNQYPFLKQSSSNNYNMSIPFQIPPASNNTYQNNNRYSNDAKIHQQIKHGLQIQGPSYLLPTISFSGTPSQKQELKNYGLNFNNRVLPEQSSVLLNSINRSQYSKQEQSLFTSPQLLQQCRRFLQKSNHKLQSSQKMSLQNSTYQIGSLESSTCKQNPNFMDKFALNNKIRTITESINLRDYEAQQNHVDQSQSNQKFAQIRQNKDITQRVVDITELYAEQVFELIFCDADSSIDFETYSQKVEERFMEVDKMIRLFKVSDKTMANRISASEFGKLLLSNCNYKPSPNPVKQIFTLIDIDRKGFFTLDDFEKFLEQVIDPEDEQAVKILDTCEKLFELADSDKKQKVDYWGFYLIRTTKQFEEFSTFLQQFQFQLETS